MRLTRDAVLKLLDTNIFICAQGQPHRFREPCRALVASLEEGAPIYTVDVELLQEVLHVYTARGERERALRTFDRLLTIFPDPAPVGRREMALARELMEAYPSLSARDAIHAAVVKALGLEGIVTTDQVFVQVTAVAALDPRDLVEGT